jgi:hypothetical protein
MVSPVDMVSAVDEHAKNPKARNGVASATHLWILHIDVENAALANEPARIDGASTGKFCAIIGAHSLKIRGVMSGMCRPRRLCGPQQIWLHAEKGQRVGSGGYRGL